MIKTIKDNTIAFCIIVLFVVIGGVYISRLIPHINGDGNEYIMQTVAFQNHLSFGVTVEDIEQVKKEFYKERTTLDEAYYVNKYNLLHEYNNAKYCNHYGSYSALVFPVKKIVMALGKYPLWAFYITNYLLYIAAVLVVFFFLKTDTKKRLLMVLLIIINPAIFYLGWTHSEVYLYSFVVIGLVFYYNKQYGKAIFFLSVAAMQNLGLLPFAMMVGINLIADRVNEYRLKMGGFALVDFLRKYTLSIVPYGLCYIPGVLPIASTYIKFHTLSHVADVASEHKYLLHKAFDYAFDLNLGILPYEPIVLFLFIIMVVYGMKKFPIESFVNLFGVGGMFFVIANQLQINSGMQSIMRYNVWIIPMMIFFVILRWEKVFPLKSLVYKIGAGEIVLTALVMFYVIGGGGAYSNGQFAPWTKLVMDHVPWLYNPTHAIFYSRATGLESYYRSEPIIYANKKGCVRKILLSKEAEIIFYSDEWRLVDDVGNIVDKNDLKTHCVDEGEYKYVNLTGEVYHMPDYRIGNKIWFYSDAYNADKYVQSGLSFKEKWGSWTDGEQMCICMHICESKQKKLKASITNTGAFYHAQTLQIYVNDTPVYDDVIEGNKNIEFTFNASENGNIIMRFYFPDSIRPSEVMNSIDNRDLGIGLLSMIITEE